MNKNILEYFLGKVCTVFTSAINRDFKQENPESYPKQLHVYFVGVLEEIGDKGIVVTQAMTGLKTYFSLNHVVAIAEEQVEHEIVEVVTTSAETPREILEPAGNSGYIDPGRLKKIVDLCK